MSGAEGASLHCPCFSSRGSTGCDVFCAIPSKGLRFERRLGRAMRKVQTVPDIHAPDVLARVRALAPDIGVIYGAPVLRPELFEIPRLGTLGIHHGRVPDYRGKKTTFWEIYNGERVAGVTIQRVNKGIDTGEIVGAGKSRSATAGIPLSSGIPRRSACRSSRRPSSICTTDGRPSRRKGRDRPAAASTGSPARRIC
jgi:hypothetical protein